MMGEIVTRNMWCKAIANKKRNCCILLDLFHHYKFVVILPISLCSYCEIWSKTWLFIKWCHRTYILSFFTLITIQNDLHSSVYKGSQRKFVACPVILLFPSIRSAVFMISCKHSLVCDFCRHTMSFTCFHKKYSRDARSGDLTGQACGPKGVRSTRE